MFNPEHIWLSLSYPKGSLTRNQFMRLSLIPNQSINLGLIPNPFLNRSTHIRRTFDHPIQLNLQSFCPSLQSSLSYHPKEAVLRAGEVTRQDATHEVHVVHKAKVSHAVHQSEDIRKAREDILQMNDTIPEAHNVRGLAACGVDESIALIRAHTGQDPVGTTAVPLSESIPHLPRLKFVDAPAVLNLWERRSLMRLAVQVGMFPVLVP